MSEFLDEMARASAARAREALACEPLAVLRSRALDAPAPPPLRLRHGFELIAEFKLQSPALGRLGGSGDDLAARVAAYATAGAAAVSVLTEPSRFGGRLEHLAAAVAVLRPRGVPAMRKDFLVDPCQLYETRAVGAGGALLILRMLSREQLGEMLDCACELGLFVLVEAFDAGDLERLSAWTGRDRPRVRGPSVRAGGEHLLIGVNCRDLQTLEVRPERFAELAPLLPRELPRVAESSLTRPEDCAAIVGHGYRLALIGGALMTAADPGAAIRAMLAAGRAAA